MINRVDTNTTLPAWRSRISLGLLLLGLSGLVIRAAYLQGMQNEFLQKEGESRYSRIVEMRVTRGMITDRHGEVLAISTPVASICADPRKIEISEAQLKDLADLLNMDVSKVQERISDKRRGFVYLKRRALPETAESVAKLNIPGVFFKSEYQRFYPAQEIAAHVLGLTDIDDQGQEGVERAWQDKLTSELGKRRVIRDRKGRIIEDIEKIRMPRQGQDLILSLDLGIQYLAYSGLKHAVERNKAKSGSIVVLDAQTGEVLALSNLPVYNPNRRTTINSTNIRNRALIDTFEPGSTLKPFAVAVALEVGLIAPDTIVETTGSFRIGRASIRDIRDKGDLTVAQVIQESSNIGTAKIALSLQAQTLWEMYNRSGFGMPAGVGFPGEAKGELRPYNTWRPIEQATMSYGHGISASLLQLTRAYTIFTTGGELKPVSLLKQNSPVMGQQVISRATALAMTDMLELVTKPGGTAPLAQVNGYRVAGKTGTAHKLDNDGRYAKDRYISSFIGYAPVSNPRLIIAVMLDEPSNGRYFGGEVAAPVFSRVMAGSLRMLNVPHDAPANNIVLFTATPEMDIGG